MDCAQIDKMISANQLVRFKWMDNKMKYLIHAHKDLPIAIHPPKAFKQ